MTKKEKPQSFLAAVWEYTRVIGGALLLAIFIRAIWFEPFRIPSSSMVPTLLVGDFLFVDKNSYGFRNPCSGERYGGKDPQRGDVVVFERQKGIGCGMILGVGSVNYIKRIVAVPGDEVAYVNKRLVVNGYEAPLEEKGTYTYSDSVEHHLTANHYTEKLEGIKHDVLLHSEIPSIDVAPVVVPDGMYVMMGDNRDNSLDSRAWHYPNWGFVKKEAIVGEATRTFFSWNENFIPRPDRMLVDLRPQKVEQ